MRDLVLTLVGPDRPGVVERISEAVVRCGGNWLGSRMAHLAGQFAGILHLEVAEERLPELRAALSRVEADGELRLVAQLTERSPAEPAGRPAALELLGQDRPGIVREIAQRLAAHGVNVEELITDRESAPMSGEPLFRVRARLTLPPGTSSADLRAALERSADDLMVEIRLDDEARRPA